MQQENLKEKIGYNDVKALSESIVLFQEQLVKDYKKYVPEQILRQYLPPEKTLILNDDPDQYPVEVHLPEPPPLHTIDGFGLPYFKQFFRHEQIPTQLKELIKTSTTYQDVVDKIERNRREYRDLILWIQKQWRYRLHGYWFWNNGVPTYIDGWHWFYLNHYHLDVGLPIYKYRDKLFFHFARYCWTTREAPFFYRVFNENLTYTHEEGEHWYCYEKQQALKYIEANKLPEDTEIEEGFWLIKYPHRTCLGFNYPKHRREGATYKGASINVEIISRTKEVHGLIQSMDGGAAETTFRKKYMNPIKRMQFFFMPYITSRLNSGHEVNYDILPQGVKNRVISDVEGLMSSIHPQTSSAELKEDGNKFMFVHVDEGGKGNVNRPYDLLKRHDVIYKTITQRPHVHGMILGTSTSDDTKGIFGRNYKELCKRSHWHMRSFETGLTQSGLFNLFIPAYINMSEQMTDKYGNPLIDKLTPQQQKETGQKYGAKVLIETTLAQKKDDSRAYYHEKREYPTRFRDCFMTSSEDSSFDVLEINNRINAIDMMLRSPVRQGNFRWKHGWGSEVEFVDSPSGKFFLSYYPAKPNNLIVEDGRLVAGNKNKFIAGCDPFRQEKTRSTRQSNAAGAVYLRRDTDLDPDSKKLEDWTTDRFVCTYSQRVPEQEYKEDMLMMTVFYGCEMFPEMNEETVYKHFRNNKYRNLLGYLYIDGVRADMPGVYTHASRKPLMFKLWKIKIETNIRHELHKDMLQECADIQGMEEMKDYDLFTSGVMCLYADYYSKDGAANVMLDKDMKLQYSSILEHVLRSQGVTNPDEYY